MNKKEKYSYSIRINNRWGNKQIEVNVKANNYIEAIEEVKKIIPTEEQDSYYKDIRFQLLEIKIL